jgi:predicted 2-oxoglutarate/Fe(II)-dependent dioxygenase YbiX
MMLANMFVDPGNQRIRQPYGMAAHHVHFRPGQLILFPSWLIHEVLPFYGQGERITIAFNCWFKRASELRPEEIER